MATVLHAGLAAAAPLVAAVADAVERVLSGRTARPFARVRRDALAVFGPGEAPPPACVVAAAALTATAYLMVPSFATGMLFSPADGMPLVAFLLVAARVSLAVASGPTTVGPALGRCVLMLPALLLASLASTLIAGGTGIDVAVSAMPGAGFVPRALLLTAVGMAAAADIGDASLSATASPRGLAALLDAIRLMTWLDLLADFLPPAATTPSAAGPPSWLAALLLWPVKVTVLAAGAGAVRALLAAARQEWRVGALRAASLLALLSGVFVLIGQTLE